MCKIITMLMIKEGLPALAKGAGGLARRILKRVLRMPATTAAAYILACVTLVNLVTLSRFPYPTLPLSAFDEELYLRVNPILIQRNIYKNCNYEEIIHRKATINTLQLPSKFDDFSPAGLVNGSYAPQHCNALISVAILVPYRNRQSQLDYFLPYMHNFLRKQNIHYKIYVIEQQDEEPFNRGLLFNVGAKHAMADKFPCLILHDVDLLPLDEANLYACFSQPRHMSAAVDKQRFVLFYNQVGGVLAIQSDHFIAANGFSNNYEGWGGEDDDLSYRLARKGLDILRLPMEVSRYHAVYHRQADPNPQVQRLLRMNMDNCSSAERDGLRSLYYTSLRVTAHPLYTLVQVKL